MGVGVRVAAGLLRKRTGQTATAARQAAPSYTQKGRVVAREGRKLGASIWRPVAHASGVLWLEVTGLFFALFALFFVQSLYHLRVAWRAGAEHQHFLIYTMLALLFLYFSASSFYRAHRRKQRRRAEAR